ncbi:MAG: metallophosphoesterase [Sedimentisphaerales bacterium]|jgi:3',5'-cyclic AMP phosphodiesterase CpdA|nr:metallophosphoesterase [Sedimentisphaerales bacterium]HNY80808.1 metallophosphoesterase [Sedimentisphaerales bacterium]HOC65217.1 metallophosphoesterase [Sedimentisphaerales bacterium]HOH65026.1 metallophosphoesterase [Sedimentisphaerales bacterium]HPY51821.1 metallophosphoesterase [Sedimentisphaerales bacterium]
MTMRSDRWLTRREFLRAGAAALAFPALGLPGCATSRRSQTPTYTSRWAFLADIHIASDPNDHSGEFYPHRNLEKVLEQVLAQPPAGMMIAGDVARLQGLTDDYAQVHRLLAPLDGKVPVYMALGNHDNRANILAQFRNPPGRIQPVKGKYVTIVDAGPMRLVLLDSLVKTNETPGLLGKVQRDWLKTYLAESDDTPLLLCFHHSLRDTDGELLDSPRLFEIIEPVPKVKALVYGHSHDYAFGMHEGIALINLPAVGYSFNREIPVGWVEANLSARGGQFTLHAVAGNTSIDGQVTSLTWRT